MRFFLTSALVLLVVPAVAVAGPMPSVHPETTRHLVQGLRRRNASID